MSFLIPILAPVPCTMVSQCHVTSRHLHSVFTPPPTSTGLPPTRLHLRNSNTTAPGLRSHLELSGARFDSAELMVEAVFTAGTVNGIGHHLVMSVAQSNAGLEHGVEDHGHGFEIEGLCVGRHFDGSISVSVCWTGGKCCGRRQQRD